MSTMGISLFYHHSLTDVNGRGIILRSQRFGG